MNADLVDFLASFEDLARTELDAEVATFASVGYYENVRVTELQSFRWLDGFPARSGWGPWFYSSRRVCFSRVFV